jgi:hypothetical protein
MSIANLLVKEKEPAINSMWWSLKTQSERILPECEAYVDRFTHGQYVGVKHGFLSVLEQAGAQILWMGGEITVLGYDSMAILMIYTDFVCLECISTPVELRGQGSAGKFLTELCRASDVSGLPIRLRASKVKYARMSWFIPHPVIVAGAETKGKLPVSKLPAWYQKYGFTLVSQVFHRGKANGWNMLYTPKK